jgi:hypothetical protein
MARRKIDKRHIRKLQKNKGSYVVALPIELVRKFGWQERQKVVVREYGKNKMLIMDWE